MKRHKELREGGKKVEYLINLEENLSQENKKNILRDYVSKEMILEYARYAILPSLSEAQIERMTQILDLAKEDNLLDFWISEIDHFLDHELGFWDPEYDRDQQSKLQEFLSVSFDDPLFDKNFQDCSKELQSRINDVCSNMICELENSVPVSVLIKFQKNLISSDDTTEVVHRRGKKSAILMDISLDCEDKPTLTLGSTDTENAKTLQMWINQLPQPYGDIIGAHKFIQDKRLNSDREIKFLSSNRGDAVALREVICSVPCLLDNKPLLDHRFRVFSSPRLHRLNLRMN